MSRGEERDINSISETIASNNLQLSEKHFLDLIAQKIENDIISDDKQGWVLNSHKIELAIPKGENYCGLLYRITITYRKGTANQRMGNVAKFIYKDLPSETYCRSFVQRTGLMEREILFYKDLAPVLFKEFVPKSYFLVEDQRFIVMDDLREMGYKNVIRQEQFDWDHSKFIVQQLARFHKISYLCNEGLMKDSCKLESMGYLQRKFPESLYSDEFENVVKPFLEYTYRTLIDTVSKWAPDYATKMKKIDFWDRVKHTVKLKSKKFNVLNHGDFWLNNILFKHNQNGLIESCRFVDFQNVRFGSPVLDLLSLIHTSVKSWKTQTEPLLKLYYSELSIPDSVYSFNDLKVDFQEKNFFGYFMSCTTLPAVLASDRNVIDLNDLSETVIEDCNDNTYSAVYAGDLFKQVFFEKLRYFEKMGIFE